MTVQYHSAVYNEICQFSSSSTFTIPSVLIFYQLAEQLIYVTTQLCHGVIFLKNLTNDYIASCKVKKLWKNGVKGPKTDET